MKCSFELGVALVNGKTGSCRPIASFGSSKRFVIRKKSGYALEKGSITVEASIVVTTIIIIIFAIIYGCIVVFHYALLNSTVTKAAQFGALAWVDSRADIESGKINFETEKDPLYARIFHDGNMSYSEVIEEFTADHETTKTDNISQKKINSIRQLVLDSISKGILKPTSTKLEINFTNSFVNRKLEVQITQDIQIPLGFLKKLFSGSDTVSMTAKGVAIVSEPAEYIRNIDLAVEYLNRIDENINLGAKINELKEKLLQGFK